MDNSIRILIQNKDNDIVNGKADSSDEVMVVYEDSSYILTVSEAAVTLFVRV